MHWESGRILKESDLEPVYESPELSSLNGMSLEEYRGLTRKAPTGTVFAEDLPGLLHAIEECLRTGKALDYFWRECHKTRGLVWIHGNGSLCGELDGLPVLLFTFFSTSAENDIYQNIIDRSRTMIYVIDSHSYEILYANEEALRYSQSRETNLIGSTCYTCIQGKNAPCEDCVLNKLHKEEYTSWERWNQSRGSWEHVACEYTRWCGHDALIQYIDNISETRKLQQELSESRQQYETAARAASLFVWKYDIRQHRIIDGNDIFSRYGFPQTIENVPESILPRFTEKSQADLREMYRRVEAGEPTVSADVWLKETEDSPASSQHMIYTVIKDEKGKPAAAYGIALDNTREKQDQEKFSQGMQSLLSSNPESLCTFQLNLTQNQCSGGHGISPFIIQKLNSDTADGMLGNTAGLIPDEKERARFSLILNRKKLLEDFAAGTTSRQIDYQRQREDGRIIWVRTFANMLKNPQTGDVLAVIYSLDISREMAQNEIFRIITSQVYDYTAVLELDTGKIETIYASGDMMQEYEDETGKPYNPHDYDEERHLSVLTLHDPADRKKCLEQNSPERIRRELDANGHYEFTVQVHFKKNGKEIVCRKFQHFYISRENHTVLIISSDVTDVYLQQLREAEQAKTEARHIRHIIDSIQTGILSLRMPDPRHVYLEYVNLRFFRIRGFKEEEIAQMEKIMEGGNDLRLLSREELLATIHPDDQENIEETLAMNFTASRIDLGNYRLTRRDGSYTWVHVEMTLAESTPKYRRFFVTVNVVDKEMKLQGRLEQQLKEERILRKEAASSSAAKTDFLSRISHDMRTPLNGILGMTHIAGQQANPAVTADCLAKIETSSKFLLGLINDILYLTRTENEPLPLKPEPYPTAEFKKYLGAVILPLCQEKKQKFVAEMDQPNDCVPVFDKSHINQIHFSLLSNAVKFTPEGGTITYQSVFRHAGPGGKLSCTFKVSDNGIGISEEFQRTLFEPFSQEKRDDNSPNRGSGIGLAVAKKLIDLMGGSISVQSSPGQGTTFTVQLTADSVPPEQAVTKTETTGQYADLAGKHVLLCEDLPLNQEIARTILEEKGMTVDIAENGQRGVQMFSDSTSGFYDLILMDIRMPLMDGYEATREIRALKRADAKRVPILAFTADVFAESEQKCLEAGMNGHIGKPIDLKVMFEEISAALEATK